MDNISSFDDRVTRIERLVYSELPCKTSDVNVVQEVTKYNNKLKNAENSNNNLKKIYSQLEDLQKYVSMCHANTLSKPPSAMTDYIEASEKQLKEEAKHLENVEKLKWVLDSEHLKTRVTTDLNVKLLKISQKQASQREEVSGCLDQTKELIDNYNRAISAVTKQFERWNSIVTRMEEEQRIVKD